MAEIFKKAIHSNQIAELLNIDLHTAKDILITARKILSKEENAMVTVKEFCRLNGLNESEVYNTIN